MAFFTQEQLNGLSITRMIFHVVGPDLNKMVLLEETDPAPFADFFLERLKSTNGGLMFNFADGSALEAALRRVHLDAKVFVDETKGLATQFQNQHSQTASEGVFMIFVLESLGEPFYALVKYDHEAVLSYVIQQTAAGNQAAIAELRDTFVKSPDALQKSALIKLNAVGGELCVRDRAAPAKVSKYFQGFLGANRRFQPEMLTEALCKITKEVAKKHSELLGPSVMSDLNKRVYDYVQNTAGFDPANKEPFLAAIYGALPEDSPVRASFDRELRNQRIESEVFEFHKAAVRRPAKRKLVTFEGIEVIWDTAYAGNVKQQQTDGGRVLITIETGGIKSEDDFSEKNPRTR
jgi:hypothetical protein